VSDLANVDIADRGDGIVVARIAGDLDLSNLHSVHSALLETLPNEAFGLVVDLAEVHFLDSSGVDTLFRLQNSLGVRQQRFAVAIPPGAPIRRALELSGAQGEIAICGSVDEAVAVLRAGPEHGAQETG
jgi:stage II sporulation protein AA (anti-sigma F factor antagonist)